ncbi:glycosyltransferase family 4 protein, partial [Methanosalsum natronophilum]
MAEHNLLVISNNFPNEENSPLGNIFVKERVKHLAKYFDNIYVVSPILYGIELIRNKRFNNYQFDNVKVFFPKYINIPLFFYYKKSFYTSLETKAIVSVIEQENLKFNLIYAHFTWRAGVNAGNIKRIYGSPVMIIEGTSNSFTNAINSHDPLWIQAWESADAIIRPRKGENDLFLNLGISSEKLFYIPNGFGSQFHPRPMEECRGILNLPLEKKILLNVGNLYGPVKGHIYFIKAIKKIINIRKDIIGIIVGSGRLESSLKKLINELDLNQYVFLVGSKPHDEVSLWMNACDIFVLPSLNEGNPNVMFEALGCGKPFVGTRVGGVPDIITSDEYGLIAEPGDSEDLAEK